MILSRNISALVVLMFFVAPVAAHEPVISLDAELRYESNVGNSGNRDVLEDWVASVGGSVTQGMLLNEHSGLLLIADMRYDNYSRYQDLSHGTLKATAKYRIQPTLGFTEPWLEVLASGELLRHRDSRIRDGEIFDLETSLGKHFTDRIQGSIGAGVEQRLADQGHTFDLQRRKLFGAVNYRLGDSTMLYLNAARLWGDQVSSAIPPSSLFYASKAIDDDVALSQGTLRKSYRMGARTDVMNFGINFPLSGADALDFSAQYARSNIAGGGIYDGYVLRAGYLYQFR